MKASDSFDIIIAGAGPAGLTAGIYAARSGMSAAILDGEGAGGQMAYADLIENYPGFPAGVTGMELASLMETQAEKFGARIITGEIRKISERESGFSAETADGSYGARSLILAVGCLPRKLGLPGEKELAGRGVSYCALCDGPLFSGREIAVIGGGNTAAHEAITLSKSVKKVKLIHRRKSLRAEKLLSDAFFRLENAEFLPCRAVEEIKGNAAVESVSVRNLETGAAEEILVGGVFIAAGYSPRTKFLEGLTELDGEGYIITDGSFRTSVPGIFACGDAVSGHFRQVVSACGSGAACAVSAAEYVEQSRGNSYG